MLDRAKGKKMSAEQNAIVAKAAKILGAAETRLHQARADFASFEDLLKKGYQAGIVPNGTDAMVMISRVGRLAGQIAAIEEEVYPLHRQATDWAKAAECDVPGEYSVLAAFAPISTKDGGR
ncbi:hypothetical protein [Mesorhizobium amorphae]|uniref:hypothetical protein n=1 Tax=Mesorhizobium amorphae TaxID=71433 RepID=UPI001186A8FB|nr:hypothetical protein [Mesorhizobium amorphae]